jgi:hypothetical protein
MHETIETCKSEGKKRRERKIKKKSKARRG